MRRKSTLHLPRSQRGFGLVDAMISLLILASVITVRFAMERRDSDRIWAGRLGHEIRQINDATASLLSAEPNFLDTNPPGYNTFNFLRHTSCVDGTASRHYLPCEFTMADTLAGRFYVGTVITQIPNGVGTGTVQIGTTQFGPIAKNNAVDDSVIAGMAGAVAQGYSLDVNSPVIASTRALYNLDVDTATITAVTTSDPSGDQWLRVDGQNLMASDLNFVLDGAGNPQFDINNVRDAIAQRFVDYDDNDYFTDPAGESQMSEVNVDTAITLEDAAVISSPLGDLDIDAASGVSIDPGSGRVVVSGDDPDEGIVEANDLVLREYNDAFTASEMMPSYSARAAYRAQHHQIVPKPDCPNGSDPKIIIGNGYRVGAENADQVYNRRVFMTDFACDGDTPAAARPAACQGGVPTTGDTWTVRYINPVNGEEYPEDERVVMTYCYFPRA